jgi:hypothetical protein
MRKGRGTALDDRTTDEGRLGVRLRSAFGFLVALAGLSVIVGASRPSSVAVVRRPNPRSHHRPPPVRRRGATGTRIRRASRISWQPSGNGRRSPSTKPRRA